MFVAPYLRLKARRVRERVAGVAGKGPIWTPDASSPV
jgi:hypothetical protein